MKLCDYCSHLQGLKTLPGSYVSVINYMYKMMCVYIHTVHVPTLPNDWCIVLNAGSRSVCTCRSPSTRMESPK